jgi:hypothetical protein
MIEITSIKVGVYRFLGKANMGWCTDMSAFDAVDGSSIGTRVP